MDGLHQFQVLSDLLLAFGGWKMSSTLLATQDCLVIANLLKWSLVCVCSVAYAQTQRLHSCLRGLELRKGGKDGDF